MTNTKINLVPEKLTDSELDDAAYYWEQRKSEVAAIKDQTFEFLVNSLETIKWKNKVKNVFCVPTNNDMKHLINCYINKDGTNWMYWAHCVLKHCINARWYQYDQGTEIDCGPEFLQLQWLGEKLFEGGFLRQPAVPENGKLFYEATLKGLVLYSALGDVIRYFETDTPPDDKDKVLAEKALKLLPLFI